LTGNLYTYRVEGALFGEAFSRESFNWNLRLSNTVKLGETAQLQLDGRYNSPSTSTQGQREGFFAANAAVKIRDCRETTFSNAANPRCFRFR
jgi:hypothetical protein